MTPDQNKGHLDYLDAVRGLAALSVVLFHYVCAYGPPPGGWLWMKTPLGIWLEGEAAVSLFFVLSGFVLSLKHFRQAAQPLENFRYTGYALARCCRLWIPFLAMVVISAALPRSMPGSNDTNPAPTPWMVAFFQTPTWPPPLSMIVHDAFLPALPQPTLVPQGWTLGIELVVSLLVPFAVLVASRSTIWLVLMTVIAVKPLGASVFIFHFMLGVVLAKHLGWIMDFVSPRRWVSAALIVAGVILYTARLMLPPTFDMYGVYERWMWIATGLGSAALLIVVISSPSLQRILSIGWIRHIGKTSYSIYLVHFIVLLLLVPQLLKVMPTGHRNVAWVFGLIGTVALCIAVAEAMYRLVELPSIQLSRLASGSTTGFWPALKARVRRVRNRPAVASSIALGAPATER